MLNSIKKNHVKIAKAIWWIFLLVIIVLYIYHNIERISIKPNAIDTALIGVAIILALMPFITEMNILGVGIKKHIEDAKEDIRREIQFLHIDNKINNSNNINISTNPMPTKDIIDKDIEETEQKSKNLNQDEVDISQDQLYLLKVRYYIDQKINELMAICSFNNSKRSINNNLTILINMSFLNEETAQYIKRVYSICSRAIHGEIVDDEYITYVKKLFPVIKQDLNKKFKPSSKRWCVCPRCKYTGYSEFDNVCPQCGMIFND